MNLVLIVSLFGLADAYLSNGLLSIAITRHHKGDIFTARGGKCYKDFCVSLSRGTAGPTGKGECECKCTPSRPVFRDDVSTCVDDIKECSLVPFAISSVMKKIPYVFLPLKGQIVYPNAEMVLSGEEGPVCVVSGGQFLGQSGWVNLRNVSGVESPFRLFRDEGRTYLQWFGEARLRMAMEGRIMLVHLMCKDASAIGEPKIFTPCIGFRVAGKPSVKEMMFATDVHLKEEYGGGLSVREYVAIGICSLLLAVVYVAAVALYLYIRKRKQKTAHRTTGKSATLTLGEEGVIKSNPLLEATRHLSSTGQDNAAYVSESNSCCSDTDHTSDLLCLDDEDLPGPQNVQTSAIIHPCDMDYGETTASQDPNNMEKLPEENVSIVETLEVRDNPETVKGMSYGNGRRKLYFNPSYFEPDLLKAPPPAAIEFLIKIREVIAIAKHKMSSKKFSPSLLGIPEEDSASRSDHNSNLGSRKTIPSVERVQTKAVIPRLPDFHMLSTELCCPSDVKQKIIRKWLEDVPVMSSMVDTEGCNAQEECTAADQSKPWQRKEKSGKESIPSLRSRQDRRKAKARAPPAPPPTVGSTPDKREALPVGSSAGGQGRLDALMPPRPPPMPIFTLASDQLPRGQGKDFVPPAVAKNLMDAVIQELTSLKKADKKRKVKDLSGQVKETLSGKSESGDADGEEHGRGTPSAAQEDILQDVQNLPPATAAPPQDDHEYEIILLHSDPTRSEGKDMKIYNLPELLSRSERCEGYSLVSEVYVNDGYSCCSGESPGSSWCNMSVGSDNVHYDVPSENPGRLTIHVNDSPDRSKAPAPEPDNFEPDTLDRKPRRSRLSNGNTQDTERYSNQRFHDMESRLPTSNDSENFTDSLERPTIMLKTNGTFNRTPRQNNVNDLLRNFTWNKLEGFGSLREIYEAKTRNHKRRKETTSLVDVGHNDHHDRTSTLSWGEEKKNKLLHRGIVLHISQEGSRRHSRTAKRVPPKLPSRPPKPLPDPTPIPRSKSASPVITSDSASPTPRFPLSPPLPPPRSVPPSPPPRSTSSPSPQPTPRSNTSSPTPTTNLPKTPSSPHSPSPLTVPTPPLCTSPTFLISSPFPFPLTHTHPQPLFTPSPPPPRPPKSIASTTPTLPPRTNKPPLPPKNSKKLPKPPKPKHPAARPLPPLPRSTNHPSSPVSSKDPDTFSTLSAASLDSLDSSDYEPFYTLPYGDNHHPPSPPTTPTNHPLHLPLRTHNPSIRPTPQSSPPVHKTRPEDSGYLSTDSDSCCPQLTYPPQFSTIPDTPTHNSETDESLCDGASESGGESIATDSFFYGNCTTKPSDDGDPHQPRPCALRLSDVEVNSDTERHCLPIMVSP